MKKILAFSGSNHSKSINQQLVNLTVPLMNTDFEVEVLDISKWNVPIYSIDMDPGQTPDEILHLISLIQNYDGFIISSPEHNGGTPAFLKNILDCLSRRSKKVFDGKPLFLMSTSPGKGGGIKNRHVLEGQIPYLGANIAAAYSLPSFFDNVKENKVENQMLKELQVQVDKFILKI